MRCPRSWAGRAPSGSSSREPSHLLQLLAAVGAPWLAAESLWSPPTPAFTSPSLLPVPSPFLLRTLALGWRPPQPVQDALSISTSQSCLQITHPLKRLAYTGSRDLAWTDLFGGVAIQPLSSSVWLRIIYKLRGLTCSFPGRLQRPYKKVPSPSPPGAPPVRVPPAN